MLHVTPGTYLMPKASNCWLGPHDPVVVQVNRGLGLKAITQEQVYLKYSTWSREYLSIAPSDGR